MLFVSIATFSQDVYMSDYSSIYHIEGCKKIKKSYYKTSLKSVLKLGFKACELCNPPTENVVDENTGNNGKELYFSDIVKVDSNLSKMAEGLLQLRSRFMTTHLRRLAM